ncbi:hypothetical protein [Flavobacterium sp.]|uniref:hypothetical protein n=1 Tax=Flavobacterium sp. TaxID=239 RepID=UPI00286C7C02|nr:hypothetical protein [Flavobacterium sp.]
MKSNSLFIGIALVALGMTSCKDEKAEKAEQSVQNFVVYTDSIEAVNAKEAAQNWEGIAGIYQTRMNDAEAALEDLKDKDAAQVRINSGKAKYETAKANAEAQMATNMKSNPNPKQQLRNALFGEGKIGDDMNFSWVNKDNIHDVYQQFVHTAEDNKDNYSREDWDEVKLMYEALDSRKNTVEKEGLSGKDNLKIAGLKIKFAAMQKVNRVGAKSDEMSEAKK